MMKGEKKGKMGMGTDCPTAPKEMRGGHGGGAKKPGGGGKKGGKMGY